jgi:hypothetical protein
VIQLADVYRYLHTSYWQDPFVLDLTPEEKYFYVYVMTNSRTTQCGIYEIAKKIMVMETGYNIETIDKLIARFVEYNKIQYCDETKELYIKNWMKHNHSESPKVKACIERELKAVKCREFAENFIQYGYSMDTESQKKLKEIKEKEIKRKEMNVPYEDIKSAFNTICISLSKVQVVSDARKTHLKARFAEMESLEAFENLFKKVEKSAFLTGKVNTGRKWKADFDWLIENNTNYVKVLEGKYDNEGDTPDSPTDNPEYRALQEKMKGML